MQKHIFFKITVIMLLSVINIYSASSCSDMRRRFEKAMLQLEYGSEFDIKKTCENHSLESLGFKNQPELKEYVQGLSHAIDEFTQALAKKPLCSSRCQNEIHRYNEKIRVFKNCWRIYLQYVEEHVKP